MVNLVLYGIFLWTILTCYQNSVKSDLLEDLSDQRFGKSNSLTQTLRKIIISTKE